MSVGAPRSLKRPESGSVALIAPHADDEVIGAGGTLALHREGGDPVAVLIVFDGRLGLAPGLPARLRQDESLRAGRHLGLSDYTFWDYPEGHVPGADEMRAAVARLGGWIRERAPEVLYAPWLGEQHGDHAQVARATRAALEQIGFAGRAFGYEVWTPLVPEHVVDVTSVWERKRAALAEFESQREHTDLLHMAQGLAAHRSAYLEREGTGAARPRYAEAFAAFDKPSDAPAGPAGGAP